MPKGDVQRHLALLQDYQDLVAGVGLIRDAIERAFDVVLPAATTTKETAAEGCRPHRRHH